MGVVVATGAVVVVALVSAVVARAAIPAGSAVVVVSVEVAALPALVSPVGNAEIGASAVDPAAAGSSSPQQALSNSEVNNKDNSKSKPGRVHFHRLILKFLRADVRGLAKGRSFIFLFLIIHSIIHTPVYRLDTSPLTGAY
jgi:hypothetical protein